jgi:hypothetical protein
VAEIAIVSRYLSPVSLKPVRKPTATLDILTLFAMYLIFRKDQHPLVLALGRGGRVAFVSESQALTETHLKSIPAK